MPTALLTPSIPAASPSMGARAPTPESMPRNPPLAWDRRSGRRQESRVVPRGRLLRAGNAFRLRHAYAQYGVLLAGRVDDRHGRPKHPADDRLRDTARRTVRSTGASAHHHRTLEASDLAFAVEESDPEILIPTGSRGRPRRPGRIHDPLPIYPQPGSCPTVGVRRAHSVQSCHGSSERRDHRWCRALLPLRCSTATRAISKSRMVPG